MNNKNNKNTKNKNRNLKRLQEAVLNTVAVANFGNKVNISQYSPLCLASKEETNILLTNNFQTPDIKYTLYQSKLVPSMLFLIFLEDKLNLDKQNQQNQITTRKNWQDLKLDVRLKRIAINKDDYSVRLKVLQEKYTPFFRIWLCNLGKKMSTVYPILQKQQTIYEKNNAQLSKNAQVLLTKLSEISKKKSMKSGDYLEYITLYGYFIQVLKMESPSQVLPNNTDTVNFAQTLYNLYLATKLFAIPTEPATTANAKNILPDLNSIVEQEIADCYTKILNYINFFQGKNIPQYLWSGKVKTYTIGMVAGSNKGTSNVQNFRTVLGRQPNLRKYILTTTTDENIPIFSATGNINTNNLVISVIKTPTNGNKNREDEVISIVKSGTNTIVNNTICLDENTSETIIINETGGVLINNKLKYQLQMGKDRSTRYFVNQADPIVQPHRIEYTITQETPMMRVYYVSVKEFVMGMILFFLQTNNPAFPKAQ